MGWVLVTIGLVLGNFLFQMFAATPNLSDAVERSVFQIVSILAIYICKPWEW